MLFGSYFVKEWNDDQLVLAKKRSNGLYLNLGALFVITYLAIKIFPIVSTEIASWEFWMTLLVFMLCFLCSLMGFKFIINGDTVTFDKSTGLISNDGKKIGNLDQAKELVYEVKDTIRKERTTRTYRTYLLFLTFQDTSRFQLAKEKNIETVNGIAERIEEMFGLPINLDRVTPTEEDQSWWTPT